MSEHSLPAVDAIVTDWQLSLEGALREIDKLSAEAKQLTTERDQARGGNPFWDMARSAIADNDALRAEVARLREALAKYAKRDDWQQAPSDFGNVPSDPYDWFMCDGNGWEAAEAALANETPTA